jgi:nucleoside-diphosphate-sugar epimerase
VYIFLIEELKGERTLMRILVIGGTGFVSFPVVQQLSLQGHTLLVVHRGQTQANLLPEVQHLLTDRTRLQENLQDVQRFAPEVVLDMIPYTQQDAQIVRELFHGLAQRVVVISSGDVTRAYGRVIGIEPGPVEFVPLTEETSLREKLYPYRGEQLRSQDDPEHWKDDYEKILVERTLMNDPGLPATILRLPMVYGPRDQQHRLFGYPKRMDDRRPAIILGEHVASWRWSRGYVGNVAAAIALAVTDARATGRIYHVCEEPTLTEKQWVQAIGKAAGWDGIVVTLPEEQLPERLATKINTSQDLIYDTTRIRQELGYREPISLDEALKQTIAWQRANPPGDVDADLFDYPLEDAVLAAL